MDIAFEALRPGTQTSLVVNINLYIVQLCINQPNFEAEFNMFNN